MMDKSRALNPETEQLRIMVVVAHPHDFTHCAGTCGIHTSQGDKVTVVTLTRGATKHNERLYDEMIKPPEEQNSQILLETREEYAQKKI